MAPHSSTLAWKIPWTEESGRLQSMGLLRVGHDRATSLSCIGVRDSNPLQCSCLENPRDGGAWWAVIYGVAPSRTRLKRVSSSSSRKVQTLLSWWHNLYLVVILRGSKWTWRHSTLYLLQSVASQCCFVFSLPKTEYPGESEVAR